MPEKIANATAVDKALYLYELLLFSPRRYSAFELAGILQCSKSTVSRLLQQIENRKGVKLRRDVVENREWYSLESPNKPPRLTFSQEEIDKIRRCVEQQEQALDGNEQRQTLDSLNRICALVSEYNEEDDVSYIPDLRTTSIYTAKCPIIAKLIEAISKRRLCIISHSNGTIDAESNSKNTIKRWIIAPSQLIASADNLCVEAWCVEERDGLPHKDSKYCTLYVQRILDVTLLEKTHALGLTRKEKRVFGLKYGTPFKVSLLFEMSAAEFVFGRIFSDDQEITVNPDGSLELTFTARSVDEVVSYILSYGASVKLLNAPSFVKTRLKKEIAALSQLYKIKNGK